VVGVTYGAEAYCVLTQDFNVIDEAAREEAEEKLTKIVGKWKMRSMTNKTQTSSRVSLTKKRKNN
jgi:hypothetical protein